MVGPLRHRRGDETDDRVLVVASLRPPETGFHLVFADLGLQVGTRCRAIEIDRDETGSCSVGPLVMTPEEL